MKTYIRSGATIFGETVKQARGGQSPSPLKDNSHSGGSAAMDSTSSNNVSAAPLGAGVPGNQKSQAYSTKAAV
jgi:hypothetical protein